MSPSILKLKVTLLETKPPIWRRLLVPETMPLAVLHEVIQLTMGWEFSHMHLFEIAGTQYSDSSMLENVQNDASYRLSRLIKDGIKKFRYTYDLGDSWEHSVVVEGQESPIAGVLYPTCVAGKRACPPEDCGGPWGYHELLEILATPDHPEREDRVEWLNREIDPDAFSVEGADQALRNYFTASGKRRPKGGRWVKVDK